MSAESISSQVSTYVSGAVVGMVVVLFVLVPHLEAERSAPRLAAACAARHAVTQGLAASGSGSAYAAAKIGSVDRAGLASDGAVQAARARFCSTCG